MRKGSANFCLRSMKRAPFRFLSVLLMLLLSGPSAFSQHKSDSLLNAYKTAPNDSSRILALLTIADGIYLTNTDSTKKLYEQALILSDAAIKHDSAYPVSSFISRRLLNFKALSLASIGYINYVTDNPVKGLDYTLRGVKIMEIISSKSEIAQGYNNLGYMYAEQGDVYSALKYYEKALPLRKQLNDEDGIATVLNNMGYSYKILGDTAKAKQYFLEALRIRMKIKDIKGISTSLNNVATNESQAGHTDTAIKYYRESLAYAIQAKNLDEEALVMDNLAPCYGKKNQYDSAFYFVHKALATYRQLKDKEGVAYAMVYAGKLFMWQNKTDSAKKYFDSAMVKAKELGYRSLIQDLAFSYSHLDVLRKDYKGAYDMYVLYKETTDSIATKKAEKESVRTQLKYEYEKRELEQQEQQKQEEITHNEETKRSRIIIWSVTAGLVLLAVFMFILVKRFRIIQSQKKVIEYQKAIVDEKNKDITDSIHYASRIQRALLTTDEYIGNHLKEYFILFKPRDIVSGDFYWAFSDSAAFHIACCDCTGHGVPGAFMSLLNISMLNESVIERKIKQPNLVLDDVRTNIIKALNPKGLDTESKDGMDCSLCTFNFANNTIDIACANNPIWIVRQKAPSRPSPSGKEIEAHKVLPNGEDLGGAVELVEIHPDKMPVGMQYGEQKPFSLHTIKVTKGDCIYMLTDGYADQFGGPKGKKFKYRQLQQLVIDNSQLTMNEQKQILEKTLNEWQGNLEQVDDILIIGIRV